MTNNSCPRRLCPSPWYIRDNFYLPFAACESIEVDVVNGNSPEMVSRSNKFDLQFNNESE